MIVLLVAAAVQWTPPPCEFEDARKCASRDLAMAERKLEQEFSAALGRVKRCGPANSTRCDNLPRAIALLKAEQRTWLAWRNAHCDVFAFGMEATSAEQQVRNDCRTDLTVKRTEELAKVRKD